MKMELSKKDKLNTIRLLKKTKAYLNSPDKLVQDWGNFYEYRNGKGSGCDSSLTKKTSQKVCKVCALGAIMIARYFYKRNKNDYRDLYAREAIEIVAMDTGSYFSFGEDHTLEEVHELYDKAIAYVENL